MNGKTARLLRKYSTVDEILSYKSRKRYWNRFSRKDKQNLRKEMQDEISKDNKV